MQEKLAKNKKAPARHKAEDDYLLTTKLFCGYCGAYLCGESGTSHTGNVHHYYKCVSVKKKRTECHKKSVRKEWIEDLVVSETMKMVMDDEAIEAIVSMLMDLQDRENVNLPLYEQQLREADTAIQNLLNAIQQGILTKSTKGRLEELEATKEELETKLSLIHILLDFFAGSGTTLHALSLLNAVDNGHRKAIIVTNNEHSAKEEAQLRAEGFEEGDECWERTGVAKYITWPRIEAAINGISSTGTPLTGDYGASVEVFEKKNAKGHNSCYEKKHVEIYPQLKMCIRDRPISWMHAKCSGWQSS